MLWLCPELQRGFFFRLQGKEVSGFDLKTLTTIFEGFDNWRKPLDAIVEDGNTEAMP